MDMGEAGGVSLMGPFRIVRWELEGSMGDRLWGVGPPWVRMTGQWGLGLPVVGNS